MKNFDRRFYLLALLCFLSFISCGEQASFEENDSIANQVNKNDRFSRLGDNDLKVLTYNTFLLRDIAVASTTQWSQNQRAEKIGTADFIKNYDVLLLQECFDNTASTILREKLSSKFPYQTPILGQTKQGWNSTSGDWREVVSGGLENGGVMIASKYPIEIMNQYIFPKGCDFDALSLKGFVYARIIKNGKRIHCISTHLQSTQPGCQGNEVSIRKSQLEMIKSYVDALQIPADEMLVYGGDFNIIKNSQEYPVMLQTLNVSAPVYKGLSQTWDTQTNTMASYHYPYPKNQPEYLDYIFVSNEHLTPLSWHNIAFDPVSNTLMTYTNLTQDTYYWTDYSDHYPVEGAISTDETSPKKSMKFRIYDKVSLRSVATGKYITSNLSKPDDWLTVSASAPDQNTWFNLVNLGAGDNYFDLKEGPVRVEISERINNFWYWEYLNGGAYYYFPKFGKSLKNLELVLVKKKNGNTSTSIENGDTVAFKDKTSAGKIYFLQVYQKNGTDWIYLNGNKIGAAEQFEVRMNNTSQQNWY
ncbi:sphingomyelin phosphodiesterase [Chryseobacterium daecheongense]|nr:sphingomyelin phosphodiesterase [Chryseobacterium daecheongense]